MRSTRRGFAAFTLVIPVPLPAKVLFALVGFTVLL